MSGFCLRRIEVFGPYKPILQWVGALLVGYFGLRVMGVFEWRRFATGTQAVAEAVASNGAAFSVVGGADSVRALNELGLADRVTWVSTGGGASLELLEGKELPGVAAIPSA